MFVFNRLNCKLISNSGKKHQDNLCFSFYLDHPEPFAQLPKYSQTRK